jgi:hypothetical protein
MVIDERLLARFWAKVGKSEACWLWLAALNDSGYGVLRVRVDGIARNERAHRLSWIIAHGPIPEGLNVLHHCDTPACVRPDHLFLGSQADNTADMLRKARHRLRPLLGIEHGCAKLDEREVREIRQLFAGGNTTLIELAATYDVSVTQVHNIVRRKLWRHIA